MQDAASWLVWVVVLVLICLIPVVANLLWEGFNAPRGQGYVKAGLQGPLGPSENEPLFVAARAEIAAVEWLVLSDAGAYVACWQRAAEVFRSRLGLHGWEQQLRGTRKPLGATQVRTLQSAEFTGSLPGVADANYVVIQFRTQFEKKDGVVEVVSLQQEADGVWRVVGYFIR